MTELKKHIHRTTGALFRGKKIVVTLAPPAYIALRLQGSPLSFLLDAEVAYVLAIRQHAAEVERRARRLVKEQKIKLGAARKFIEREIRQENGSITRRPKSPRKAVWVKCKHCGLIFAAAPWPKGVSFASSLLPLGKPVKCPECGNKSQKLMTAAKQQDGVLLEPIV